MTTFLRARSVTVLRRGVTGRCASFRRPLYGYTIKTLVNWSRERGRYAGASDNPMVMQQVAHSLSKSQIEAVAAYLSNLN